MSVSQVIQLQTSTDLACRLQQTSGVNIRSCYQCGKCTAGCPTASAMDITPRQVIRYLQLGQLHTVLSSQAIWLCASCQTCVSRCPRQINMPALMDTLRHLAYAAGGAMEMAEPDVRLFHESFLGGLETSGRLHELRLILQFNVKSKHLLKDAVEGLRMFSKGKISVLPEKMPGSAEVTAIFRRVRDMEEQANEQ